jgi:preprotein translocase subunit SecD
MQGNGFKVGITIFFVALCGYYLIPSFQNLYTSYQMDQMEASERAAYQEENRAQLREIKENSLKLGLDLQGGMHVTLEVQVGNLLRQLASNKDATFREVLQTAIERARTEDVPVVTAFVEEFEARDPEARLSRYFRSEEAGITRRSSNDEVLTYLQQQADDAVTRAMEIVRNRVDRYGVTEPSIQRKGDRRVVVELPGIDNPERVRNLLESASQLTFHLMAEPQELTESAQDIIAYYEPEAEDTTAQDDSAPLAADTTTATPEGEGTSLQEPETGTPIAGADTGNTDTGDTDRGTQLTADADPEEAQNDLLAAMQPLPYQGASVFGRAFASDTARVRELLSRPAVQRMLPQDVILRWTANPVASSETGEEAYDLLAVQEDIELSGEAITDASVEFDQFTNQPRVSMTMNADGARTWSRVTGANVGEQVAIVLDGVVYSYPRVEERITGGRSSITGLDSRTEAQDIVTVLKSGALPAPVDIVEERTVGPSLGEASIRAGFISVTVGLLLVALFMILYYRTAGVVADIALLLNVVLILGILAGFKATLTLPGIAGIVLTIGMAVDANVLIYDRIREEQGTGKTIKAAIASGYEKALSAILDANITTFFVGVILYSFGVGPIQGFAVTLMAGILSSLFTAIIVTRVLFDYLLAERRALISYG